MKLLRYGFILLSLLTCAWARAQGAEICEAVEMEETQKAPDCEGVGGFQFLPATFPVSGVFIPATLDGFSNEMITLIQKHEPTLKINVLTDIQEALRKRGDAKIKKQNELQGRYLRATQGALFPESIHRVDISTSGNWPQDFMVIGQKNGQTAFLKLPYSNDESFEQGERNDRAVGDISKVCRRPLVAPKFNLDKDSDNSLGGNIYPLPGKIVAVGTDVSPSIQKFIAGQGYQVLQLKTEYTDAGHVDELISLVPHKNGGTCDFTLFYSSPKFALESLQSWVKAHGDAELALSYHKESGVVGTWNPKNCVSLLKKNGNFHNPKAALACEDFVKGNMLIHELIQAQVTKVVSAVKRATGCVSFPVTPLPTIFDPYVDDRAEHADFSFLRGLIINANPTNALVLNKVIIAAKQPNELFANLIQTAFESTGNKLEFVNAENLRTFGGGVHCASNTIRYCREK